MNGQARASQVSAIVSAASACKLRPCRWPSLSSILLDWASNVLSRSSTKSTVRWYRALIRCPKSRARAAIGLVLPSMFKGVADDQAVRTPLVEQGVERRPMRLAVAGGHGRHATSKVLVGQRNGYADVL